MLLSLLADILAMDTLIRLWAKPLPWMWWQVLAMFVADLVLMTFYRRSVRCSGRKSQGSRNLGLLAIFNRLGLVVIGLSSLLP
jgi:hypothetical protein